MGNDDIDPGSAPCSLRDAAKIEEGTASRSEAADAPSTGSSCGMAGGGPCWVGSARVELFDQAGRKPSDGGLRDTLTRGPAHQQCCLRAEISSVGQPSLSGSHKQALST